MYIVVHIAGRGYRAFGLTRVLIPRANEMRHDFAAKYPRRDVGQFQWRSNAGRIAWRAIFNSSPGPAAENRTRTRKRGWEGGREGGRRTRRLRSPG